MKTVQRKFFLFWLPVLALCVTIFIQSCFPSLDSEPSFPMEDKVMHMAAYGLLAVFFCRACRGTWPGRWSPFFLLLIGVLFATLYGVMDEFHQGFVAARQADAYDLLADFVGSLLAAAGYVMVVSRQRGCKGG